MNALPTRTEAEILAEDARCEAQASLGTYPTRAEREHLCEASVTLNGERAKITGAYRDFAMVTQVATRLGCEFAWATVALVVSKGGRFES